MLDYDTTERKTEDEESSRNSESTEDLEKNNKERTQENELSRILSASEGNKSIREKGLSWQSTASLLLTECELNSGILKKIGNSPTLLKLGTCLFSASACRSWKLSLHITRGDSYWLLTPCCVGQMWYWRFWRFLPPTLFWEWQVESCVPWQSELVPSFRAPSFWED